MHVNISKIEDLDFLTDLYQPVYLVLLENGRERVKAKNVVRGFILKNE